MKRLALVLFLCACNSSARTETQQLVTAVDRFRKAENAEKPSHVDAIKQSPCTDAEVCALYLVKRAAPHVTCFDLAKQHGDDRRRIDDDHQMPFSS